MISKVFSRRTWLFSMLIVLFFLMINQVLAQGVVKTAVQTNAAIINTGAANLRYGPGIGYEVVAVANQGETVSLLGRNADSSWIKVQMSNGTQGWVSAPLLSTSTDLSTLTLITDVPDLNAAAIVATGALNVRSGPGVTYSVLTNVSMGQSIGLIGRASDNVWVKARLSTGQEGWVNSSLITPNVSISSLPLVDIPAPPEPAVPVAPGAQLSLRTGPSLSDTVIGHVFQGQRVQAIGRNNTNTWLKVRILETGLEGWISAAYVQVNVAVSSLPILTGGSTVPAATATPIPASTAAPTATPTPLDGAAVVTSGALNMRSGPGVGYGVVAVVYQGHTVSLIGRTSDSSWAKVRNSANQEGWVNATYLSSNIAISSLPVVDAATLTAVGIVNTGALNVRSGPGIEYGITAVIYQYQSVGLL
ncbi:MAG: SH3 domain-containing protein [Chloroflexi bacterium]|nr:MAG: SH3 domain-containing protein [Chloroflexota bacterium]